LRTAGDRNELAARERMHRLPGHVEAACEELILHIGRGQALAGLREETDRRRPHHQRAPPSEDVFEAGARLPDPAARDLVQGVAVARLVDDTAAEMILQIVADAGQFVHDIDAVPAQQVAWADAGELQELRRQQRAAGEQYLAPRADAPEGAVLLVFEADRALAIEQHAMCKGAGL